MAFLLLGAFILINSYLAYKDTHRDPGHTPELAREVIPAFLSDKGIILAHHDFEAGNAGDPASHLASFGHSGKQSLKMNAEFPFSPGLWITFKDLNPGDTAWIRATGYVWFTCPVSEAKCSLVATCNHKGVNYKYMFVPIEKESVKPGQWNKITIDYQIPPAASKEDVVQCYFWYRGAGEMLVDDIEINYFMQKEKENH